MRDPMTLPGADGGGGLPCIMLSPGQAVACLRGMSGLLDDGSHELLRGLRQDAAGWFPHDRATVRRVLRSDAEIAAMPSRGAS